MTDWKSDIEQALVDFVTVAKLAGKPISREKLVVEYMEAPHVPPARLPQGKMAVYGFWYKGEWLKVGMVGSKSNARYTSQHYNPASAQSTLAGSLLQDPRRSKGIDASTIGPWIKENCNRVNILMDNADNSKLLALLEAFLHVRLKPRYEK